MSDNFESVKKSGPIWEPKQTGKKKDKTLKPLKADDKSFITGYYLGMEEVDNSNGNGKSQVHKLKMKSVGDDNHIIGERDGDEVSIWGTGVLNDNLSKVGFGQLCKVVWLGKQEPKQGSNAYHNWDVLVDKTAEPYSPNKSVGNTAAAPESSPAPVGAPAGGEDDDDDLPF